VLSCWAIRSVRQRIKPTWADAFADYCAGKDCVHFVCRCNGQLASLFRERGYASIEFAGLLIADPQNDPETDAQGRHLRQHLNHTRRMGVMVASSYLGDLMHRWKSRHRRLTKLGWVTAMGRRWYLGRPGSSMIGVGRRWFIAKQAGKVVGFLSMLRVGCTECQSLINIVFPRPPPRSTPTNLW